MKLSVSVPDGLWEATRRQRPDLNPSHLVQEALEAWTRSRSVPAFSQDRPDDVGEAFAEVRERLAAIAREEFEGGYRAALEAARVLDFWVIESLAGSHFDVVPWAESLAVTAMSADQGHIPKAWGPDNKNIGALVTALGNLVGAYGDDTFRPRAPYIRGFAQAMRDLWEEAFEGTVSRSGSTAGTQTRSRSRSGSSTYTRSKSSSASGSQTESVSRSAADDGHRGGDATGAGHSDGSGWGDGDASGAAYGDGTGDG